MNNIESIIKSVPLEEKRETISYLENNIEILKKIRNLTYIEKIAIYELFEDLVWKLRLKFFPFKKIYEIERVFQEIINLHINLLIDLKKPGIENYFVILKGTSKYWILKSLSLFRFVEDIRKLSEFLLLRFSDVFAYLHKAYKEENNDELIFGIFKQYISRLFSTPEYISEIARRELIQSLLKNDNFRFFYGIEKYKNYIEKLISDNDLLLEEIQQKITQEKIDLSGLKVGLIFGDKKSVKAYKNYIKKKKSLEFIKSLGLKNFETNFEILEDDFKKQRKINVNVIKNRLFGIGPKLDIILCFETDHRTEFYDKLLNDPDLGWRIILNTKEVTGSNKSGQHFSKDKFEKMLLRGIDNYFVNIYGSFNLFENGVRQEDDENIDIDLAWREKHKIISNKFEGYFLSYHTDENGNYTTLGKLVHDIKYTILSEEQINLKIDEILKYIPNVKKLFGKVDMILPVPFSIERNFQLVNILAERVSEKFKIPIYYDVLIKWKQTKSLKDLTKEERIKEITGAFIVENEHLLNGKNVLIFDDIYDSGVTINEIYNVLKEKTNVNKIYVLTLTKTRKECALSYKN